MFAGVIFNRFNYYNLIIKIIIIIMFAVIQRKKIMKDRPTFQNV